MQQAGKPGATIRADTSITERRNTNGVTKSTAYTYNFHGGVTGITYPSGRTVTYTYNAAGETGSASDVANSITYASNAHYTPAGALASLQESGSNLVSTMYYNNRLQPCRISVKSSGTAPGPCSDLANVGNVMDFTYGFNSGSEPGGTRGQTGRSLSACWRVGQPLTWVAHPFREAKGCGF
jgi:YD repeat-containing protein